MKRKFLLFLVALFTLCGSSKTFAQVILSESFTGTTFPPTGWSNVSCTGSTDGSCFGSGVISWIRTGSACYPSFSAHSSPGMALYNNWSIYSGSHCQLTTPAMDFSSYGSTGTNQLSFWVYNSTCCSDYMTVYVNTAASTTGATALGTITLSGSTTGWNQYTYTLPSGLSSSSTVYVMFYGYSYYGYDMGIDDISVLHIGPCSGTPTVTTAMSTTQSVCSGGTTTISADGGISSGQLYQWQSGTSATGPWTNITGATNTSYTTPAITSCSYFQLKDSCSASGLVAYGPVFTVCPGSPAYASVPYFQDFESWTSFCSTSDVPGGNWKNTPARGDSSWRREDQGWTTGGWNTYGTGYYNPNYWVSQNLYVSGSHSARFHSTPGYGYSYYGTNYQGNLDLYINCSATTGNKLLQFYYLDQSPTYTPFLFYNNDSIVVWLSTDGGTTFNRLAQTDTAQRWKKVQVQIPSNSANSIIRIQGKRTLHNALGYGYDYDYSDMVIDSVYVAPPCTGTPPAGVIVPTGTISACAGSQYTMNVGGLPLAGGYQYTWQMSTNGGTTWANTGDTGLTVPTPSLWTPIQYRVLTKCAYGGSTSTSTVTAFNITNGPSYAPSLPYVESFERFQNRCGTADAFSPYTATYPTTGYVSWRRHDKGSTAGWYSGGSTGSPYCYSPFAIDSTYSARVETYYTYNGNSWADQYHFIDCSGTTGAKELNFNYNMNNGSYSPPDTLIVSYSVDSGGHYTRLGAYTGGSGWSGVQRYPLPSNSPKTVVKFTVQHPLYYSYGSGVGLDLVKVIPPCTGKPTAGSFPASTQCADKYFFVTVKGYSLAAGLKFQWQVSPDNFTWANTAAGDTTPTAKLKLSAAAYLRVIVTCSNSGLSDTTASQYISMKPFYFCYCDPDTLKSGSEYDYIYFGFTNVSITKQNGDTLLNNGNPVPVFSNPRISGMYSAGLSRVPHAGYNNYDSITRYSRRMYLDSLYWFYATCGSTFTYIYSYPTNIYIDYNHNATFDLSEKIFDKSNGTTATTTLVKDSIRIPHDAQIGITGMRILYGYAYSSPLDPCGPPNYHYGEVQDYLVNIEYRPCNGPVTAGTAETTDTAMCAGYSFMLTDTTHEYHQSGTVWFWQSSADGVNYGPIAGTTNRDTLSLTFTTTTWYRMAIVCANTHDTSYSVVTKVSLAAPYKCYCYSMSVGGKRYDSSDIGAFTIGKFVVNKKGPHVLNPVATGSHTNYTGSTIHLAIDSSYAVGVYHILRSKTHGDGKVTMFIDYNNNFQYDIPEERVWTGYTSASDWYITTTLTVPHSVIGGVPTGMRLIINNNTSPNIPSDSACGIYTSGETQDYVVQFDYVWPLGVGTINGLQNLDMYPNPTSGKFTVSFNAERSVKKLQINVTNMTGQVVMQRGYENASGHFSTELDMTAEPRGMYFVEFVADGERMIRKLVIN